MTPAEITKLTEQASRAKVLMAKSSVSGEKAKAVFDSFEITLAKFNANVEQVKANDLQLNAMLSGMGNAEVVLDAAFQDDKAADAVKAAPEVPAAKPTFPAVDPGAAA